LNRGFAYTNEIDSAAAGETVLDFYVRRYPHSSESEWRQRICSGAIRLDGKIVTAETLLSPGRRLIYARAPWVEPDVPGTFGVIHADDHVIAVDKPSGLPVLPSGRCLEHTLLALVRKRFGGEVAPSPLHRLGRGTSGLVLFARTRGALRRLTEAFSERRIEKVYRALVQGVGLTDAMTIEVPIGRIDYAPIGKLYAASSGGVAAASICRLLREDHEHRTSLVEVRIITGRPHQIRIHMAAIGHPLVGDPLYISGGVPAPPRPGERAPVPGDCGYQLHATRLSFQHPETGRHMNLFSLPPPSLRLPSDSR
jgi:23S rRNA pseudouridine1911/1915/1917 synthase